MGRGRELPGLRKNGEEFLLHLSVSEMNLDGSPSFTAIVHDLTASLSGHSHEQARDQVWLGSVLDHTPAAVTVKDMQGRYLLLNHRAEACWVSVPVMPSGAAMPNCFRHNGRYYNSAVMRK